MPLAQPQHFMLSKDKTARVSLVWAHWSRMHLHRGPSETHTSRSIKLKGTHSDRKRCLSFLKEVMGLCSTTAFVNSYLSYSIIKPFWKAGGKASPRKNLHSPPSSAILPPFLLLLNPMLYDPILLLISNLLPLTPALGLVVSLTDLFQFPMSAGEKLPGKLFARTLFHLPGSVSCTGSQRGALKGQIRAMKCPEDVGSNWEGKCICEDSKCSSGNAPFGKVRYKWAQKHRQSVLWGQQTFGMLFEPIYTRARH